MKTFTYSEQGFSLTKSFEGFSLNAYQDCAGLWTIGYGHTGPHVTAALSITEPEAERLLRVDLAEAVVCVNRCVNVPINQSQFDALVDFCFNVGRGNLLQSTLLRKVNIGDFATASSQFGLWTHVGGKPVPGLVRRRNAEAALFAGQSPSIQAYNHSTETCHGQLSPDSRE